MMISQLLIKNLFLDVLFEVAYFPLWWYSRGLKKTALFCWRKIRFGWRFLALGILLVNLFKPMYGERGWDAYLLSLMARFGQIVWRLAAMLIYLVFWLAVLAVWLALPLAIINQLFNLLQ